MALRGSLLLRGCSLASSLHFTRSGTLLARFVVLSFACCNRHRYLAPLPLAPPPLALSFSSHASTVPSMPPLAQLPTLFCFLILRHLVATFSSRFLRKSLSSPYFATYVGARYELLLILSFLNAAVVQWPNAKAEVTSGNRAVLARFQTKVNLPVDIKKLSNLGSRIIGFGVVCYEICLLQYCRTALLANDINVIYLLSVECRIVFLIMFNTLILIEMAVGIEMVVVKLEVNGVFELNL